MMQFWVRVFGVDALRVMTRFTTYNNRKLNNLPSNISSLTEKYHYIKKKSDIEKRIKNVDNFFNVEKQE